MPFDLKLLLPWEFYPSVFVATVVAAGLWIRGMRRRAAAGLTTGVGRTTSFFVGLALVYGVMQTYADFIAQHMFWVHRLQAFALHHVGAFLIALAMPHEILWWGLPAGWGESFLLPLWRSAPVQRTYRFVQHPVTACLLFAGVIYLWLIPEIHFRAMLSVTTYKLMNWSMLAGGLLFQWLMVDPRPPGPGRTVVAYPVRIVMLFIVMLPQIVIGAHIALADHELYDVYDVCGRAWPLSPLVDQEVGGLLTWIPPAMMSVVSILLVLHLWMQASERTALPASTVAE